MERPSQEDYYEFSPFDMILNLSLLDVSNHRNMILWVFFVIKLKIKNIRVTKVV